MLRQPAGTVRIVMKLVDFRGDTCRAERVEEGKPDGGLEARATDVVLSFLEVRAHRQLVDRMSISSIGMPRARNPFRLVDQFPREDDVTMVLRDFQKGPQCPVEKTPALGRIEDGIGPSLFDPAGICYRSKRVGWIRLQNRRCTWTAEIEVNQHRQQAQRFRAADIEG